MKFLTSIYFSFYLCHNEDHMFSWPQKLKDHQRHRLYYAITVGFILFIAAFTRLWKLGEVPVGLTWDEAALGYIGKMVITTGMDEHFDRLPIAFQSFGDYKAPLAMYITGIFTTLFGMSAWVVRLPYALSGIASVAVLMWITWRLTEHKWYVILAGWLMAITPWHLMLSRVGFESGMALLCLLVILAGWLEVRKEQASQHIKNMSWIMIVLSTVAGIYVYHSTKVVLPLTLATLAVFEYFSQPKYWQKQWRTLALATITTGVLLLPFFWTVINGTGLTRASQTTVFAQYGLQAGILAFIKNFGQYFSIDFLARGLTDNLRHGTGSLGALYWSQLALLLLGFTFGLARPIEKWIKPREKTLYKTLHRIFPNKDTSHLLQTPVWLWVVLLLIGLLPAAIGVETPHANRALLALPAFIILMVSGARELERELNTQNFLTLISGIILVMIIEWASFWNFYLIEYRVRSSTDWLEGYEEAVTVTHSYIAQNLRTKFTTAYGEPGIFFAFYNQIPFHTYRQFRVPGSVQFGPISTLDINQFDVLITPEDKPLDKLTPVKIIYRSDNSPAFYVYETR